MKKSMIKRSIVSVFVLILLMPLSAQVSIEKLFQTMPDDLLWLDHTKRTELFAYFKDKQVDSVSNGLNGYCKIVDYDETAKYISVNTSRKGNIEMQVFEANSKPVVGVIITAYAPAVHSDIRFFNTDWTPAEINNPVVTVSDYLKTSLTTEELSLAQKQMTPLFVRYDFTKGSGEIVATCTAEKFLSEEDWKQLKPLQRSNLVKFVLENGTWNITQE
jgi:hypothetical protein